jgi:hypothetical protein
MGEERHRDPQHGAPPTPEEFEEARHRELARLNVQLSSTTSKVQHTPEDLELLKGDTHQREDLDRDVVRRWSANSERHGGGSKLA